MATTSKARKPRTPACGYTFDGKTCRKRTSPHYCEPRADRVVQFFALVLVHTKGVWARQAFELDDWQEDEIIRPLFGTVVWSAEFGCFLRQYTQAWIELARKNGKSELAAGIALYLLVADDEEGAEVYGAAKDRKQAHKVWDVAQRMRELSEVLCLERGGRLGVNRHEKRIFDLKTASYYETITRDALGELGANPHGTIFDEVISQPDGSLWFAMSTAEGTRRQALLVALTTAGNDPTSFAAVQHEEMAKIAEDPARAPHIFVYMRNTPQSADPWDERNWGFANPALGRFKSIEAMRRQALEARNDPTKEAAFRQFQLNQWLTSSVRWISLPLWDTTSDPVEEDQLQGRPCYAGLDLASTTDLASWVLLFPPAAGDDGFQVLWRFWTPEAQIPLLDEKLGGLASQWVANGHLVATEGDWIDYEGIDEAGEGRVDYVAIHPQIAADARNFRIQRVGYDNREAAGTAQFMQRLKLDIENVPQGYGLSGALKEILRLVKAGEWLHGGHPVARWNADSAAVKMDDLERVKLVKPDRLQSGKRIDGLAAAANAVHVYQRHTAERQASVYEERDMVVLS